VEESAIERRLLEALEPLEPNRRARALHAIADLLAAFAPPLLDERRPEDPPMRSQTDIWTVTNRLRELGRQSENPPNAPEAPKPQQH
jgi:hypothetical protein